MIVAIPERQTGWRPASLQIDDLYVELSVAAREELEAWLLNLPDLRVGEPLDVARGRLRAFALDVERWRQELDAGCGVVILRSPAGLSSAQRRMVSWTISNLLGQPLVQNSEGMRLVHVYDRERTRRMADGARYHQTREGGSIHTDNVNIPDPWEYLVFHCIEPALIGGETILVDGHAAHERLEAQVPEALEILRQPFWWEYRGIADKLYQAPVVTYDAHGRPRFRYLRPYLESAHQKAGERLTERQMWALDVLDSVLELSDLQLRLSLRAGETLVTDDSRILHGRTCFADHYETITLDQPGEPPGKPLRRSFDRTWISRR